MNTTIQRHGTMLKVVYLMVGLAFTFRLIQSCLDLSFKFILTSVSTASFILLLLASVLQKGKLLVYISIVAFAFMYVFNLFFIVSSVLEKEPFKIKLSALKELQSIFFLFLSTSIFYWSLWYFKYFTTIAEQRIVKLFVALMISIIVVEKVISLSLPYFSNAILGIFFLFFITEFITIGIKTCYPREDDAL